MVTTSFGWSDSHIPIVSSVGWSGWLPWSTESMAQVGLLFEYVGIEHEAAHAVIELTLHAEFLIWGRNREVVFDRGHRVVCADLRDLVEWSLTPFETSVAGGF